VTKRYCDESVCRGGMKFGTGVGVNETNYATESFPEIQEGMGFRGRMRHSPGGAGGERHYHQHQLQPINDTVNIRISFLLDLFVLLFNFINTYEFG